jgi:hypothetical protein
MQAHVEGLDLARQMGEIQSIASIVMVSGFFGHDDTRVQ